MESTSSTKAKSREVTGGICDTCNSRSMCMYLRDATAPIVHCDEFDGLAVEAQRQPMTWTDRSLESETAEDPVGLCRSCADRATCMHAKTGAAVWQCEDYR